MATPFLLTRGSDSSRLFGAAAIAVVVELGALGIVLWLLIAHRPPIKPATALTLLMAPPQEAAVSKPITPPVLKPLPQPEPRPQPHRQITPLKRVEPQHQVPTPVTPAPLPIAAPSMAPSAPPPAPPVAPPSLPTPPVSLPSAPDATFDNALRTAIQTALRYPDSARMAGISGRTRVAFKYRDGRPSDETVVQTSGSAALDRAALAAVRDAVMPKPAPAFAGKTLSELVWVTFTLNNDNE
ncbi:TonB family protein [Burkholderia sp. L27(2015)]|uniref:TonB family protein n=1 Tax=Burkholderia sp. L27(2015) TaxID=1641858 RepID=UPI00131AA024|nr:TonB family protein [Burkholderia sp. L27(2015)]